MPESVKPEGAQRANTGQIETSALVSSAYLKPFLKTLFV